jgi:DNA adenine methylase
VFHVTPLRYPGGKGELAPFLGRLIAAQASPPTTYVEPFAGGAGAALRLLHNEYVERVVLNDLDKGIAALWRSVFRRPSELARKVEKATVTVAAWRRHRNVYLDPEGRDDLELGFATLFLNRTNRSGILTARPIGGLKQTGRWKIDARFNRSELVRRIELLSRYRNRVTVLNEDGVEMVAPFLRRTAKSFVYVDPPYLGQGSDLYLDTLGWADHQQLATILQRSSAPWLATYDLDDRVPNTLYPRRRCATFSIAHTAAIQHVGGEYAVFSDRLVVETLHGLGRDARFVRR